MATFDVHKAINYLQTHKKGGSTGNCAAYTKRALQAGGLPYCSGDGWSVVDTYIQYGFKYINVKINGQKIVGMVAGDICSIACNKRSPKYPNYNKGGEVYPGHACMFDGTQALLVSMLTQLSAESRISYNVILLPCQLQQQSIPSTIFIAERRGFRGRHDKSPNLQVAHILLATHRSGRC